MGEDIGHNQPSLKSPPSKNTPLLKKIIYTDPDCIASRSSGLICSTRSTEFLLEKCLLGQCSSLLAHWLVVPGDLGSKPGVGRKIFLVFDLMIAITLELLHDYTK